MIPSRRDWAASDSTGWVGSLVQVLPHGMSEPEEPGDDREGGDERRQHRGYLSQVRWRLARHGQKAPVIELRSLDQLRRAFNDDTGTPRLVFLFSPT